MSILIGSNINIRHGFITAADYAHKSGSNVFQIFFKSPHLMMTKRRAVNELVKLKSCIDRNKQKVLIHGSFTLNFCNPIASPIHNNAIANLVNDLNDSVILGAIGVVVHMGHNTRNLPYEHAINNYIEGIRSALKLSDRRSVVIFETGAGQGSEICTSLFELGELRKKFTVDERKRIKFCLDTCHIYAAGYDIANPIYVEMLDDLIDTCLGWENVVTIHLNDSVFSLNCRKDRHADIGKGSINIEGIKKFVILCVRRNIPIFLETPCNTYERNGDRYTHEKQISYIKSLIQYSPQDAK